MSLEDFQVPLATKVYGTRNLHDAFSGSDLDLFVTLSSAIGVIGTDGQATYAAGNTFQDAFPDSQPRSHTHYMSIDIGTVADTQANTEVRNKSLRRAGLIPIENNQLLGALYYSMSTKARDSDLKQIVIGFDGNSLLRTKGTNATAQSAMFSEVFNGVNAKLATDDTTQMSQPSKADSESATETTFQQHTRIVRSITQKISSLITSGNGEISTNKSLTELGLDSLLAIDLKSWILNEFQVDLSAPDILGKASITALAGTVISHLQPTNKGLSPGTSPSRDGNNAGVITPAEVASLAKPAAISKASKLPELPLPDLETTLIMFLSSRESFLSHEEYEATSEKIKDFLDRGSKVRTYKMNHPLSSIGSAWCLVFPDALSYKSLNDARRALLIQRCRGKSCNADSRLAWRILRRNTGSLTCMLRESISSDAMLFILSTTSIAVTQLMRHRIPRPNAQRSSQQLRSLSNKIWKLDPSNRIN